MYPHQTERLTGALESAEVEALVATSVENVFYLTGFRSFTHAIARTPQFAVWSPRGSALVVPATDLAAAVVDGTGVDHVFCFGTVSMHVVEPAAPAAERIGAIAARSSPAAVDALAVALDALALLPGRVALDEGALTPEAWQRIAARMSGRALVPGAAALLSARRIKGPYEIECLERALVIAEEALNALFQELKPGVSEREAVMVYEAEVTKRGGVATPSVIAGGDRSWITGAAPTERALRAGDLVRTVVGATFKGYHGMVARTAVMGEPDARQQALHDAVQAGLEAAIGAVRAGTPAGGLLDAAVEALRAAGLPDHPRLHVGHGVGLAPSELPELAAGVASPLDMGEVLRIEIPYAETGRSGVEMADTVLVTRVGGRPMNRSRHGLVVLD